LYHQFVPISTAEHKLSEICFQTFLGLFTLILLYWPMRIGRDILYIITFLYIILICLYLQMELYVYIIRLMIVFILIYLLPMIVFILIFIVNLISLTLIISNFYKFKLITYILQSHQNYCFYLYFFIFKYLSKMYIEHTFS